MGEMIEYPSNGSTAAGYLATAVGGSGPGVVVIQEWWGLVDHIKDVCERFAGAGFSALAPDLYHGATVPVTEPSEAGKEMMAMRMDQVAKDMSGAVDEVARRSGSARVGVTGFCMGGGLALVLACQRPDLVKAVVPWYGIIPWEDAEPDYSKLDAPVLGHYAQEDGFASPLAVEQLEGKLREFGKTATLTVHKGVDHAFFNDTRPEVYDAATSATCWEQTLAFFHAHLS